ncbi:hypothetical protein N7478_008984 [Penicillium angulare]|uniref:uncharacterized protein n=1 Tax=Penicillium angulare TaxID=116970 RepID=UPI002540D5B1|nr:uncharacterized protein N7478_008984 [Penicillium angulare]KAJ5273859.1 hypothetical protein N7478_008984 [Penicillium angulare]
MRSTSTSRLACHYSITHSLFRHDYEIISANGKPNYHVNNSHLTPGKPDLTFHVGSDAKGPIAGQQQQQWRFVLQSVHINVIGTLGFRTKFILIIIIIIIIILIWIFVRDIDGEVQVGTGTGA